MEVQTTNSELILSGEIYISEIENFVTALKEYLGSEVNQFRINMSAVETIDTAALQLLIAFKNSAEEMEKTFAIISVSELVREVLELTGLTVLLLPPETPKNHAS